MKHDELRKRFEVAIREVASEFDAATATHGEFHSAHEGFAVMLEEMDELKVEVWKRHRDPAALRFEAIQVAAMALRFLVDVC